MEKPSREPKIRNFVEYLIESGTDYTPEDLEILAKKMMRDGILSIRVGLDCIGDKTFFNCYSTRFEDENEAELRYEEETLKYNKFLERIKRQEKDEKELFEMLKKKYGESDV